MKKIACFVCVFVRGCFWLFFRDKKWDKKWDTFWDTFEKFGGSEGEAVDFLGASEGRMRML